MAVAERDLTSRRQLLPWTGVVAPWLLSRVVSIVVLLAAVNDPTRGSRFEQVATRWDGAFYPQDSLGITQDMYASLSARAKKLFRFETVVT